MFNLIASFFSSFHKTMRVQMFAQHLDTHGSYEGYYSKYTKNPNPSPIGVIEFGLYSFGAEKGI